MRITTLKSLISLVGPPGLLVQEAKIKDTMPNNVIIESRCFIYSSLPVWKLFAKRYAIKSINEGPIIDAHL